ncbi:hypothetical protein VE04_07064, partial [Pseudogymnoascus sp. 24MN13]
MISIFLAEELERATTDIPDTYFLQYFCDSRSDECNTGVAILRGLLFQLLQLQPKLIDYILPRFEVEKSSLFTLETLWEIFEAMICDAMLSDIAEKGSGETLPELEVAILIERELRPSPIKIPLDMIELQKTVESPKFLPVRTPDANVTFVIQKAPSFLSRRRAANLCFMGETDK